MSSHARVILAAGICLAITLFALAGCGGTDTETTLEPLSTTTSDLVPETSAANTPSTGTLVTFDVLSGTYGSETLRVSTLTEIADVIVKGRVVEQLPARWNGPDGKKWAGTTEDDIPMLYTTWYVHAEEVLKGDLEVGEKVAFRMEGGLPPEADQATKEAMAAVTAESDFPSLKSGEELIIFGFKNDTRYGGTYEPAGYWIVAGNYSIFLPTADGSFKRILNGAYEGDDVITSSQVKALIRQSALR